MRPLHKLVLGVVVEVDALPVYFTVLSMFVPLRPVYKSDSNSPRVPALSGCFGKVMSCIVLGRCLGGGRCFEGAVHR